MPASGTRHGDRPCTVPTRPLPASGPAQCQVAGDGLARVADRRRPFREHALKWAMPLPARTAPDDRQEPELPPLPSHGRSGSRRFRRLQTVAGVTGAGRSGPSRGLGNTCPARRAICGRLLDKPQALASAMKRLGYHPTPEVSRGRRRAWPRPRAFDEWPQAPRSRPSLPLRAPQVLRVRARLAVGDAVEGRPRSTRRYDDSWRGRAARRSIVPTCKPAGGASEDCAAPRVGYPHARTRSWYVSRPPRRPSSSNTSRPCSDRGPKRAGQRRGTCRGRASVRRQACRPLY